MARTCRAWFRHAEDVEIQIPACGGVRTYFAWEDVLLVGHHGHIRKPSQLPPIVAAERPALWGAARWRYLLLGHRHQMTTRPYDKRQISASQRASHEVPV